MSGRRSREQALRLCAVMNEHDFETLGKLVSDNYFSHANPEVPGPVHGPQVAVEDFRRFTLAFPDYHIEVLDLVVEDDRAVIRIHESGTHLGDGLGIAGSGRPIDMEGVWILRFDDDGKLVELWVYEDNLRFMQQLGVLADDILD